MKNGGVTYPEGFLASGVGCGIKPAGRKDLALIYSEKDCTAAGCFTSNQFKSHSLIWSQKNITHQIRAILVNSGNANACNGPENWKLTCALIKHLAGLLKVPAPSLLFASTGLIGRDLPSEKIISGLDSLLAGLGRENHQAASEAILTTDTHPKETALDTGIAGRHKKVVIGGMAKGAGMISPNMATMLAFLTTDAVIARAALEKSLREAVDESFNMITVDNDQSTNDMVVCLANGAAGNPCLRAGTVEYERFAAGLKDACRKLAQAIAFDGEGASKEVEVRVSGGWCLKDARRVARKIAGSNLVKSALAGAWPNWGRILAATGATNARMDVRNIEIRLCGITVYRGQPRDFSEDQLRRLLKNKRILIEVNLLAGAFSAAAWGCDLTEEYVKINREE